VTIASSTLRGNSAVAGGAVRNALDGQVSIDRSLLEDNDASLGGALANPLGIVSLSETTLRFNEAAEGGAILNLDALSIDGTTISENGRLGQTVGGGIRNSGTLVAVNSTVSGNMAGGLGAGVATDGGRALLSYCTITANRGAGSATGGLWSSGPVVLRGTVVAGNHNGPEVPSDCFDGASSVTSRGHNLVGNGNDCPNVAASTDQVGSFASPLDPGLDALRFNGGPTPTHALLPGSPAIDVIPAADCTYDHDGTPASPEQALLLDQRHVQRPRGLGCDIGAYEISGEFVQCVADLNQCKRAVINGNGDVNADGQVDGLDSDLLRRILAGLAAE
jgi:hypothetical protein